METEQQKQTKQIKQPQTAQLFQIGQLILSSSTLTLDELINRARTILLDKICREYLNQANLAEQNKDATTYTG